MAIHSGILEDVYVSNPGASLKRLEGMGFALNLAALAYVSRAWWRTRRPFLIYVIGTVSALMLGTTLFLSTEALGWTLVGSAPRRSSFLLSSSERAWWRRRSAAASCPR